MKIPNTDLYEVSLMAVNSSGKLLDPHSSWLYSGRQTSSFSSELLSGFILAHPFIKGKVF